MFGHLFPPSFKNWWSDDWISTVYGAAHTFVVSEVQIKHNVGAQKTKGTTRYEVDKVLDKDSLYYGWHCSIVSYLGYLTFLLQCYLLGCSVAFGRGVEKGLCSGLT